MEIEEANLNIILQQWKLDLAKASTVANDIIEEIMHLINNSMSASNKHEILHGFNIDMISCLFKNTRLLNMFFKLFTPVIAESSKNSTTEERFFKIQHKYVTDSLFLYLVEQYQHEVNTRVVKLIYRNLEYFMKNDSLVPLFFKYSKEKPIGMHEMKPRFSPITYQQWDLLIQKVVSLPDIIHSKLVVKKSSIFKPSTFYAIISRNIQLVLEKIQLSIQNGEECNVLFCSRLLGKICFIGQSDVVMKSLLPPIKTWLTQSPLLRRICSKLFEHVNDMQLESVVEPILSQNDCPSLLIELFGDSILKREKLKFLFTHKFLLVKFYSKDIVPLNILRYLSARQSLEGIFKKVLFNHLQVWGNESSVNYTSYEQHCYITRTILIASSFLNQQQKITWRSEIILQLMNGIQVHLQNPNEKMHQLAMVVAECITTHIDENGKQLKFDLEHTDEIIYMKRLSTDPEKAIRDKQRIAEKEEKANVPSDDQQENVTNEINEKLKNISTIDLDSDDDLEPINAEESDSEETVQGVKPPLYLRDCMAGLLSSKDSNRQEVCLNTIEKLAKKEPGDLKHVGVEIVKILLHLQDQYEIADFDYLRFNAMVAVTVRCPNQVSGYLCEQFYEENYSINQRLDILHVIRTSAQKLSQPSIDNPDLYRSHLTRQQENIAITNNAKPEWQVIVDERIKSKTKYKSKIGLSKQLKPVENEFAKVAGLFFFPLLKNYGRTLDTCDLFGNDSMVLSNLIHTLATVIKYSHGLQIIESMAKSLFEVIWSLRYHRQNLVRQALLYAVAMVFQHVPSSSLITVLQADTTEANEWLNGVVLNDPCDECKRLAISCLKIGHDALNEAFGMQT